MHEPVLLHEVIRLLNIKDHTAYLDGTIGLAGHTSAILNIFPNVKVVGIDRDRKALEEVKKRLTPEIGKRLFLFKGNFKDISILKRQFPIKLFHSALLDLGVSSFQLDDPRRGFSFQKEGPLDMRMDDSQKTKAMDLVNFLSERKLADIFFKFGEEHLSFKIAKWICQKRKMKPIKTTLELSNLISEIYPRYRERSKIHPATRVFQALRIAVNEELEGLEQSLEDILSMLETGGRLAVISFHSLEDRIVKRSFLRFENPCICPKTIPKCVCMKKTLGKRVILKPLTPSPEEIQKNPRSRSAKLRVVEKGGT